jgi:hypothetical protein
MIFGYFTLAVALLIEIVGAYYSITGLAAIFSGAVVPILIMGGVLEVGKVTAAVWLKNNWHRASLQFKAYLLPAVTLLMFITSMGIFGFLSKAHNDQNLVSGDVLGKIAIYDEKIKIQRDNIDSARRALQQMDAAVDQTMARSTNESGADKATAIRRSQARERTNLQNEIARAQTEIVKLNDLRAPIAAEVRKVEAEVGPIKYIAKLIYGDNPDANLLEQAVVWVIIMIVAVFDPLALVLILAAQQSIRWARGEDSGPTPSTEFNFLTRLRERFKKKQEPKYEPDDAPLTQDQLDQINALVAEYRNTEDLEISVHTEPTSYNTIEVEKPKLEKNNSEPVPVKDTTEPNTKPPHVNPNALGLDVSNERPGDYLKPTENDRDSIANADFGTTFPDNPKKADLYVRVDYLPSKLFKFNGSTWIEINKGTTDSYTYNEQYIQHLVEQVESGVLDINDLTPSEQDSIGEFLKGKNAQ